MHAAARPDGEDRAPRLHTRLRAGAGGAACRATVKTPGGWTQSLPEGPAGAALRPRGRRRWLRARAPGLRQACHGQRRLLTGSRCRCGEKVGLTGHSETDAVREGSVGDQAGQLCRTLPGGGLLPGARFASGRPRLACGTGCSGTSTATAVPRTAAFVLLQEDREQGLGPFDGRSSTCRC